MSVRVFIKALVVTLSLLVVLRFTPRGNYIHGSTKLSHVDRFLQQQQQQQRRGENFAAKNHSSIVTSSNPFAIPELLLASDSNVSTDSRAMMNNDTSPANRIEVQCSSANLANSTDQCAFVNKYCQDMYVYFTGNEFLSLYSRFRFFSYVYFVKKPMKNEKKQ